MNGAPVSYFGKVISVQGTTPGPAVGITYTVDVNMPDGVRRITGIKPYGPFRWSVDIDGAKMVDKWVEIWDVSGHMYGYFVEPPVYRGCSE